MGEQMTGTLYLLASVALLMATLFCALRFLMQVMRVDAYNPISQSVLRLTNPVLTPLRRVFPSGDRVDTASLFVVWLLQVADIALAGGYGLVFLLWGAVIKSIALFANLYFYALIVVAVMSFIAPASGHPAAVLLRQLTEPLLAPVRQVIRPVGGLDFSLLVVLLGLMILRGSVLPWLGGLFGA